MKLITITPQSDAIDAPPYYVVRINDWEGKVKTCTNARVMRRHHSVVIKFAKALAKTYKCDLWDWSECPCRVIKG